MTVTVPLAKPTAICDRSSRTVMADICVANISWVRPGGRGPRATDRKLLLSIVDVQRAQARRHSRLLDQLIQRPDLQDWLGAQVLGDSDEQARAFNLSHVGDCSIVGLEAPHDLPAGPDDAHVAVIAAEEEAVGAGADLGDFVALKQEARFVVGHADLRDVEEVEFPPLRTRQRTPQGGEGGRGY
jgi:hypothetical protein